MANDEADVPPLAVASQNWNWRELSQNTSESSDIHTSSSSRLNSVQSQCNVKSKSLLLNRPPTSTLSETKPKTIATATECVKPVKCNNEKVEEFSQVRIADRTISIEALRQEMEGRKFIKLQQMDRVPRDTFTNGQVGRSETSCAWRTMQTFMMCLVMCFEAG